MCWCWQVFLKDPFKIMHTICVSFKFTLFFLFFLFSYSSMLGFEIMLRVKSEPAVLKLSAVHQRIYFLALANILTVCYIKWHHNYEGIQIKFIWLNKLIWTGNEFILIPTTFVLWPLQAQSHFCFCHRTEWFLKWIQILTDIQFICYW